MTDGAPPGPGSGPKIVRTSLVDSGWSVAPPSVDEPTTEIQARPPLPTLPIADARMLPSYAAHEAAAGMPDVTQVDPKIQSRAKAMREKDTIPPPRRASAFPPAAPPPAIVRPQEPPVVIQNAPFETAGAVSSASGSGSSPASSHASATATPAPYGRPPIGSVRPPPPSVRPPPPSAPRNAAPMPSVPPPPAPQSLRETVRERQAPPEAFREPVRDASREPAREPAVAREPDPASVAAARSAATIVRPRSVNPPAVLPSFGAALTQRVRFAGGEVPLWSLVTPLVLLVALGAAFAAAAVTSAADPGAAATPPKASAEPSASVARALPAPLPPPPALSASSEEKPKPLTLLERAAQGDDGAVKELSAKPVADLNVEEAISLSMGQSAQDVRAARALRDRVDHDPGLIKDAEVLSALRRYTDDPETARDALAAMANVPGPISPDLIYEVWTATASRTTATDLARSLIYSKEVRAKASPALAIALSLRDAETCEQNRDLLPKVTTDGDKRAYHLLSKLTRKYGCGPNKRADCYACLRDGKDLDAAMKAVKSRREPHPFGG